MFYGTTIATCILVLKKSKNKNGIFFINASNEFVKGGNKNKLTTKNIENILDCYFNNIQIDNYSKFIDYNEIKNRNYDLSIEKYIKQNEQNEINILDVNNLIEEIIQEQKIFQIKIYEFINKLNQIKELKKNFKNENQSFLLNFKINENHEKINYKKIKEIFDVSRGRIISKEYIKNNQGNYPVYSSQTLNNGILGKISTYDYDGEYLTWTANGYAGNIFYRNGKFSANTDCGLLKLKNTKINILYLYFILKKIAKNHIQGVGYSKLSSEIMRNIEVPIPSRETQDYIANQLQILNEYYEQYLNNLEKENKLRKTQLKYYKNLLLDFNNNENTGGVVYKKIKDIFDVEKGKVISKDFIKNNQGSYSVYSAKNLDNGVLGKISTYDYDGEYLTWTADGYAGKMFYRNGKFNIASTCGLLKLKGSNINILYIYFLLDKIAINYVQGRKDYNKLSSEVMKNIEVPIPSRETQDYIANHLQILNKYYEQYLSDLEKESQLRKTQLKYYKNLLLNFNISENNV